MTDTPSCNDCEMIFTDGPHVTKEDCIKALQKAMRKQKAAATDIGMDISISMLRVLEELSLNPECGYQYQAWDPIVEGVRILTPRQVSGVFASIMKKFKELGNWRPMEELREREASTKQGLYDLEEGLVMLLKQHAVSEDVRKKLETLVPGLVDVLPIR